MEWAAFWLCVAVFIVCECVIYLRGSNTAIWEYKTDEEKAIQRRIAAPGEKK